MILLFLLSFPDFTLFRIFGDGLLRFLLLFSIAILRRLGGTHEQDPSVVVARGGGRRSRHCSYSSKSGHGLWRFWKHKVITAPPPPPRPCSPKAVFGARPCLSAFAFLFTLTAHTERPREEKSNLRACETERRETRLLVVARFVVRRTGLTTYLSAPSSFVPPFVYGSPKWIGGWLECQKRIKMSFFFFFSLLDGRRRRDGLPNFASSSPSQIGPCLRMHDKDALTVVFVQLRTHHPGRHGRHPLSCRSYPFSE